MLFVKKIGHYIIDAGSSHKEIAARLGVCRQTWRNYLTGAQQMTIDRFIILRDMCATEDIDLKVDDFIISTQKNYGRPPRKKSISFSVDNSVDNSV
jgi:plasmid maintenance system antidote protein VapI